MPHSGQFELSPRKKHNRKRAALRLEFGVLFLCTLGLAYLSYWLFVEYREERETERASTLTTHSPGVTELEPSSRSFPPGRATIKTKVESLTDPYATSPAPLEEGDHSEKIPVILSGGEVHIGTDGVFTTTTLPAEWYRQRVVTPLSASPRLSLEDEFGANATLSHEVEQLNNPVTRERTSLPATGGDRTHVETTPASHRPNAVIEYNPQAVAVGKLLIGISSEPDYGGNSVVDPYRSDFNSAPNKNSPIGREKTPIERNTSVSKTAVSTLEELSDPAFTLQSETRGSFSAAPSRVAFPASAFSAEATPNSETSDFSSLSIFKNPNYDEELLNRLRYPDSNQEIPIASPVAETTEPPSIGNRPLKQESSSTSKEATETIPSNALPIAPVAGAIPHPGIRPVTPIADSSSTAPSIPVIRPIIPNTESGRGASSPSTAPPYPIHPLADRTHLPFTPILPISSSGGSSSTPPSPITPLSIGTTSTPVSSLRPASTESGSVAPAVPPATLPASPPTSEFSQEEAYNPAAPEPEKDPRLKILTCTPWTVQSGQTIESLAQSTGSSPGDIREINGITSVQPGQTIRLPIRFPVPCCE